jgi:hypothetical protein
MIISLHAPKAAGSSFRLLLEKHYKYKLLRDYNDFPLNKTPEVRNQNAINFDQSFTQLKRFTYKLRSIECIHGHFLPYKYKKLLHTPGTHFITWLRDPIERLLSHYHFWQRTYDHNTGGLHLKMIEENWTLEEFCFSKELQNFYTSFLWEFPIENFDFIGITEHFDEDMQYFSKKYLQKDYTERPTANSNPYKRGSYLDSLTFLDELKAFHAKDYELYNYALEKRKERL